LYFVDSTSPFCYYITRIASIRIPPAKAVKLTTKEAKENKRTAKGCLV